MPLPDPQPVRPVAPQDGAGRSRTDRATVSVILPTYNRATSVAESIDSILAQTVPADQIVVVDDGSTDGTEAVLARYVARPDVPIEVIRQTNQGVNAARNAALDAAWGDWVTFLDSDDLWRPDRLAVLHRDLLSAPETVVVHAANLTIDGFDYQRDWLDAQGARPGHAVWVDRPFLFAIRGCYMQAMALRRSAIADGLRFDLQAMPAGDTNFFAKIAMRGPWLVAPETVAEVRRLPGDTVAVSERGQWGSLRRRQGELRSYLGLRDLPLTAAERRALHQRLSLLYFGLSKIEGSERRFVASMRQLLAAAAYHPNPAKGWAKAALCLTLGVRGYEIATGRPGG